MRARLLLSVVGVASALHAREALAGMPHARAHRWSQVRVETLSFFIVVLLVCVAVIRWLWNGLAKDFPAHAAIELRPDIGDGRAFGALPGSRADDDCLGRELLTPGAWQKQGLLYNAARAAVAARAGQAGRSETVGPAVNVWKICKKRSGVMPNGTRAGFPRATLCLRSSRRCGNCPALTKCFIFTCRAWLSEGTVLFSSNENRDSPHLFVHRPRVLAFEPDVFGGDRLVLRTDGTICRPFDGRASPPVAGEAAMIRL